MPLGIDIWCMKTSDSGPVCTRNAAIIIQEAIDHPTAQSNTQE